MKTPEEYVEAAALFDDRWLRANLAMLIARVQRDAVTECDKLCQVYIDSGQNDNGPFDRDDMTMHVEGLQRAIRALLPKEPSK